MRRFWSDILVQIPLLFLFSITSQAQWTQTSGPTGALVHDIISTPGYIFVNSGHSGIFRSSDNGLTWSMTVNGLPDPPDIITLISNGSTLYAGIRNSGVYASHDNGTTWIPLNEGISDRTFMALFADGDDIYAGTDGFFYSPDKGETWIQRESFQGSGYIHEFVKSGNKIFASVTGATLGVYVSENKGLSWEKINLPIIHISDIAAVDNAIYVLSNDIPYVSRDFGETWSEFIGGTKVLAIGDTVLVGGWNSKIYFSDNEGVDFSDISVPPSADPLLAMKLIGDSLFVGGIEGVWVSPDKGVTWAAQNDGLRNVGVTFLTSSEPYVYAGAIVSEDNGVTWSKKVGELRDANSNVLDWTPSVLGIHIANGDPVLGLRKGIFKSTDNGQSWILKQPMPEQTYMSVAGDDDKVVVANSTTQYYSTDGGDSWSSKSNAIFNNSYPGRSLVQGDTIVILGLNSNSNQVYISKNFGVNWESFTIPNVFTATQAVIVNKKLFVATWSGVFVSPDFGATWSKVTEGLPADDEFTSLAARNSNLYVGTSEGVYVSYNEGGQWYPINDGLTFRVESLAFSNTHIFAGTHANSVWTVPNDKLNIVPVCTALVPGLEIKNGKPLTITLSDFVVYDPDSNFPEDFELIILPGDNYSVTGNAVVPEPGFVGDLSVSVMVNDGHNNSRVFVAAIGVITGVENEFQAISLYPNPATDKLQLSDGDEGDIQSYRIRDSLGRVLPNGSELCCGNIEISHLPPGIYFLETFPNRTLFKFIKK